MRYNDKLFSIVWFTLADNTAHRFLLFAPNAELAHVRAVEIVGPKGRVNSVDQLNSDRAKRTAAGKR